MDNAANTTTGGAGSFEPPYLMRRGRFMAWLLGVDWLRFASSRTEARYAGSAVGILLLLSLAIAFTAMATFAYARMPEEWGPTVRTIWAGTAAACWALFVGNLDRVLLILSETISGRRGSKVAMFAARFGVAIPLTFLVADQIVHTWYDGPIRVAAQQISLERRTNDSASIETANNLPLLKQQTGDLIARSNLLDQRRQTLPQEVSEAFEKAGKCDQLLARQVRVVANLQAAARTTAEQSGRIAQAQKRYADIHRQCVAFRGEAERGKSSYLADIDQQVKEVNNSIQKANRTLADVTARAIDESQASGRRTTEALASASSQEIAFERAATDHPEIRRNAWLLRIILIILDILPMAIKSLAFNNPLFIGSRAILAEDSALERMRERMVAAEDESWRGAFCDTAVVEAWRGTVTANAATQATFREFDQLLRQIAASELAARNAANRRPRQATEIWTAFSDAVLKAFRQRSLQASA